MDHFDGAVGEVLLPGLAAGGGVDGDEAVLQGEADQEVGGAEIALDEDVVAGGGLVSEPGLQGLQVRGQGREVRGDLAPEVLERGRQGYHLLDA